MLNGKFQAKYGFLKRLAKDSLLNETRKKTKEAKMDPPADNSGQNRI